jgi:hypothetical protein
VRLKCFDCNSARDDIKDDTAQSNHIASNAQILAKAAIENEPKLDLDYEAQLEEAIKQSLNQQIHCSITTNPVESSGISTTPNNSG